MEQTASDLRQRGNFEFSAGHYDAALSLYTAALEATTATDDEERILNLCNRSAVYYIQEEYELSKTDAESAWELSNQTSVKAAYRLAKTALQLRQNELAKCTIQAGLRVLDDQDVVAAAAAAVTPSQQLPSREPQQEQHPNIDHPSSSQRKALQDLWKQVLEAAYDEKEQRQPETSIKYVKRPISVKEFVLEKTLGHGNFSEIVAVHHRVTHEQFALKKIEKKQAADLYKRQHPNVYNEIQMERRVLLERLPKSGRSPFIIQMYHAFQDYNTLYYLMDLHTTNTDLWSHLRYKPEQFGSNIMIGCHRSTAKLWLHQLVDALEFLHRAGIVHRDLKPENLLLDARSRIVVIDFGTAKDLLSTDLNGPEFVGTPDFMSPEAVSGKEEDDDDDDDAMKKAGFAADLWALGAVAFILQTGHTPYWSPSPYLAFLKIKRAVYNNLTRPMGIVDDDCWDLIHKLMRYRPEDRLGANVFTVENGKVLHQRDSGYDILRQHPYFADVHNERNAIVKSKSLPIPSLSDLCIRAVADLAYQNSQDLELCDRHPPGDGSKYDLLRLGRRERAAVLHCLDRCRLLSDPRCYARFFKSTVESRLDKIRPDTRDVVGLTQMNDDQGKPPRAKMNDQYAKPVESGPIQFVHLTNPLLLPTSNDDVDEVTRKKHTKLLKKCVANINRSRPKMVVVAGKIDGGIRKTLARISETIPVVVHDGSAFFTFWLMGVQCIALSEQLLLTNNDDWDSSAQISWLREQLEQVRLSKHPLYVFVDCDPRKLSLRLLKKLAQGRTLCVFGLLEDAAGISDGSLPLLHYEERIDYKANEVVDDTSIRSTESQEDSDRDSFSMQVKATCENGLRWITVEEEPDMWSSEFKAIELPPPAPTESQ